MQHNTPFFSVIIPLFNKAPHVARSVGSVLNQTFNDFELIIVNDASTDGSLEEVQKFIDPRIRIFHRDNPGPGGYAARNLGVREAKSDWVAFLDADDEWASCHLMNCYNGIVGHPNVDQVSCGWNIFEKGKYKVDNYYKKNYSRGEHLYGVKDYIKDSRPLCMSVYVVKRNLIHSIGGFDENWRHGADQELWFRVLLEYEAKGLWLPYIGATYFRDSVNMVTHNLTQFIDPVIVRAKKYLLLSKQIDHELTISLRKYVNIKSRKIIARRMQSGGVDLVFIKSLTIWEALKFYEKCAYRILSAIPITTQKKISQSLF